MNSNSQMSSSSQMNSSSQMSSSSGLQKRASGGTINAGQTYLVGENGPELFISGKSGTIIPNHKIGTNIGTSIYISITGNAIMGDGDADRFGDLIVRRLKSLGVT
jgi:hypothetical protein